MSGPPYLDLASGVQMMRLQDGIFGGGVVQCT